MKLCNKAVLEKRGDRVNTLRNYSQQNLVTEVMWQCLGKETDLHLINLKLAGCGGSSL